MEFTAIDFETANSSRTSPCSLGIVSVKDFNIESEKYYLINPEEEFDRLNIYIHGITSDMVIGKPNFKELWPEIEKYFEGKFVIAHCAAFDMSVLRNTLDKYSIRYPNFRYSCTNILSKKVWHDFENYKLDTISNYLNIKFNHHNAVEDARAAALIFNEIMRKNDTDDFEKLHSLLRVKIGMVYNRGYKPAKIMDKRSSRKTNTENIRTKRNRI